MPPVPGIVLRPPPRLGRSHGGRVPGVRGHRQGRRNEEGSVGSTPRHALRELGALALWAEPTPRSPRRCLQVGGGRVPLDRRPPNQARITGLGRTAHWASAECAEAADGVPINLGAGMAKACRLEGTSK